MSLKTKIWRVLTADSLVSVPETFVSGPDGSIKSTSSVPPGTVSVFSTFSKEAFFWQAAARRQRVMSRYFFIVLKVC